MKLVICPCSRYGECKSNNQKITYICDERLQTELYIYMEVCKFTGKTNIVNSYKLFSNYLKSLNLSINLYIQILMHNHQFADLHIIL